MRKLCTPNKSPISNDNALITVKIESRIFYDVNSSKLGLDRKINNKKINRINQKSPRMRTASLKLPFS